MQEVETKRLSIMLVSCPLRAHIGKDNIIVPNIIIKKKLDTINLTGEKYSLRELKSLLVILKSNPPLKAHT